MNADSWLHQPKKKSHQIIRTPNRTSCDYGWNYNRTEMPYESISMEVSSNVSSEFLAHFSKN